MVGLYILTLYVYIIHRSSRNTSSPEMWNSRLYEAEVPQPTGRVL